LATSSVNLGDAFTQTSLTFQFSGVVQQTSTSPTPTPTTSPTPTPTTSPTPTPTTSPTPTPTTSPTPTPTTSPTPTPTTTYTYTMSISGSNYQMKNGTTEQILYQSLNPTQVANNAIGNLTKGGNILFHAGTYNLQGSIIGSNKNNVTLTFENGAILVVSNGMNAPAIYLNNANNWLIQNVTIDGNAANQVLGSYNVQGIQIQSSSNSQVDGANIYNCRRFGFYATGVGSVNVGITNSKITNCGWNGITLGGGFIPPETGLYAKNNDVAYCGDVGITNLGFSNIVQNNYVHDINNTSGFNNAHWGIAVEGSGNDTITGNIITNCDIGMMLTNNGMAEVGTGDSNTVSSNNINHCLTVGIQIDSDYNIFSNNQITQWDWTSTWKNAITIVGNNNQILGNSLSSTFDTVTGILLASGNDNIISANFISSPSTGGNRGVSVDSGCVRTIIEGNQISGFRRGMGIGINSGAIDTAIESNNVTLCTGSKIINLGTATQIYTNPGYNPVGYITKPISSGGTLIVDSGSSSTWISGKVYTNDESPKQLDISGGAILTVVKNGEMLFTASERIVILQPGDTFSVTFSTAPTIIVFGQ
jgi:parallel beta-helix repeat protein